VAGACAWCGAELAGGRPVPGGVRCAACGVATTMPRPTDVELARAYEGSYRPPGGRFAGPGDLVLRRSRAALAGRLDGIAPPGQMLDVGAGEGHLIDALERRGREAAGLERDAGTHPRISPATIEEAAGAFAAIVFWHSLEHLPAPAAALREAVRLLAPEGVLVVAMPNASSVQASVFGERWLALDLPRHLVHVPAPVLLATLRELGLRIERVSYLRGGQVVFGWLHGLVGRLPGAPDLYDAIRRPAARSRPLPGRRRAGLLAAAALMLPFAGLAALVEAAARRGGTVYVEARAPK
jgi:SAM-dependent methyltransferase